MSFTIHGNHAIVREKIRANYWGNHDRLFFSAVGLGMAALSSIGVGIFVGSTAEAVKADVSHEHVSDAVDDGVIGSAFTAVAAAAALNGFELMASGGLMYSYERRLRADYRGMQQSLEEPTAPD